MKLSKEEKLKHCSGCEDNFYNGNNNLSVKECWGLPTTTLKLRKKVRIDHVPPWDHAPKEFLNCYHENGYVFMEGDRKY